MAIRSAAKGTNVLLVLDDVWDPKHEKPLNCIDPDNASRLLVTTRMRGLLRNCAEVDVDVLSRSDAMSLLLSSADVDEASLEEGSEEPFSKRRLSILVFLIMRSLFSGSTSTENNKLLFVYSWPQ